jgi:predicted lipoprotein with Yx(FWY)xxD motif
MALVAACGGAAPSGYGGAATPKPAASVLKSAQNPRLGQILTTASGMTLYYFTPEKDGHLACTGDCVKTWVPLVTKAGTVPPAAALPGKVGTVGRPDGTTQVTYNEFPLYIYTGDMRPGDLNGQGFLGQWFAVPAVFQQDADSDADGTQPTPSAPAATQPAEPAPAPTAPAAAPSAAPPAPTAAPRAAPTPCSFSRPNFNDGDGDNAGGASDGDGCG